MNKTRLEQYRAKQDALPAPHRGRIIAVRNGQFDEYPSKLAGRAIRGEKSDIAPGDHPSFENSRPRQVVAWGNAGLFPPDLT